MSYQNNRLIDALNLKPVDKTPVWLMRQAGRYLPEYRLVREKMKDFMSLCKHPEAACEVSLQPLRRFDLDAAIIFSDILTIPDALGLSLQLIEHRGPWFEHPIQTERDLMALSLQGLPEKLTYVYESIRLLKQALNDKVPIIGFAGSPWTIATYMVEGQSSKEFRVIKSMMMQMPSILHHLLKLLTEAVCFHLQAQADAGCRVLMLFDTWGGVLSPLAYQQFSLRFMETIIQRVRQSHPHTPLILFTKGGGQWLDEMASANPHAIGLDWTTDIRRARAKVPPKVALQGNLDPAVLYATPSVIKQEVKRILSEYGPHPGHVFNLGHGIPLDIDPDHVKILVDAVHEGL